MGTKCKFVNGMQIFSGDAQMIATNSTATVVDNLSTTGTVSVVTNSIPASIFTAVTQGFRLTIIGTISSEGTADCTFSIRCGSTEILSLVTVSLADEDDKVFELVVDGIIKTVGASGKIVAWGELHVAQATPLHFYGATAAAGTAIDTTAATTINVTTDFDVASADTDVIVLSSRLEFFN